MNPEARAALITIRHLAYKDYTPAYNELLQAAQTLEEIITRYEAVLEYIVQCETRRVKRQHLIYTARQTLSVPTRSEKT